MTGSSIWRSYASLMIIQAATLSSILHHCPPECICLSHAQVLCNSGGLSEIPIKLLPSTVEQLSFKRNNFAVIKSDAFAGLRLLKKLSLDGNNVSTIKPFAFRGLPRLKELSIQHSPLPILAQFAFAGLQNITSIILTNNKIKLVECYCFAGTSNLKQIVLSNNPIMRIQASAFSGLTNVERIVLPSGIKIIEPDAFNGLEQVGFLKLAYMDLQTVSTGTFRGLIDVNVLSIQESDLGTIKPGAFEELRHVDFLNLLNNKIDYIDDLNLHSEQQIQALKLQGNHILNIPKREALSMYVHTLTVISNHFPCDCHIHELIEGPLANGSIAEFTARNFCISPLEMNGRPIEDLDLEAIGKCHEHVTTGNLEATKVSSGITKKSIQRLQIVTFFALFVLIR